MTDKLWLLPFGPDQFHLPALHSPDSGSFLIPRAKIARGFSDTKQTDQRSIRWF